MTSGDTATVAAFDLDGTITRHDTLLPFLRRTCGTWPTTAAILAESLVVVRALAGTGSRHDAKERLLGRLLAGRDAQALRVLAETFADVVLERGLRPAVRARVADHLARGDDVVIVTASPELYVEPLGSRLGVTDVLGTRLEVDEQGRLTGRFVGENCRGPEKVERLRTWLDLRFSGGHVPRVVAYGDSAGDTELLAFADVGIRLVRGRLPRTA